MPACNAVWDSFSAFFRKAKEQIGDAAWYLNILIQAFYYDFVDYSKWDNIELSDDEDFECQ